MKWLDRFARSSRVDRPLTRNARLLVALEPRMMFDGAIAATAAEVVETSSTEPTDTQQDSTPQQSIFPTAAGINETRREVVFIDASVQNSQQLLAGLPAGIELVQLDGQRNGLEQIAEYLDGRSGIDSIHLLSHGESGAFRAGDAWFDAANLATRSETLARIGAALSQNGDILLYGCKTGEGATGSALITELARLTQADVAASSDNTGAPGLGGNWVLEISSGSVETAALAPAGFAGLLAAPTSLNFDSVSLTADSDGDPTRNFGSSPRVIDGWTITLHNSAGAEVTDATQDYLDVTNNVADNDLVNGSNDKALSVIGYYGSAASARFTSTSGDAFWLQSFVIQNINMGTNVRVVGYRGVDAVASQDFTLNGGLGVYSTINLNHAADQDWQNITQFRIVQQDGSADLWFAIDDIVVAPNVLPNVAPTATNLTQTITYTEDPAGSVALNDIVITDTDVGDTLTARLTLSNAAAGALTTGTFGSATSAYNAVTGLWTVSGSVTDVNAALAAVAFTPAANWDQDVTITTQIRDAANAGPANGSITLDVTPVQDAPSVTNPIADQDASEDAAFSFQFNADVFREVDTGDTLTYSAQLAGGGALPAWLSFNAATRTFSGTPANNDVGALSIQVTANDGNGGSVSDTFTLTVANTNDAPTVATPIPDQSASEDAAFNFQFASNTFNDQDIGDTLIYSAQLSGGGALPAWLSFNAATRTFSGIPLNGDVGTLNIQVTANDGNGGSVSDTFTLTVANTNDAPTLANPIPDQNASEDAAFNFQFASNTFSDQDIGDTLTYSAQLSGGGALPAWLSFNAATRTFSGTPADGDVGVLSIEVTASDNSGSTVTDTFTLSVANIDATPVLTTSGGNAAFIEGQNVASTPIVIDSALTLSDSDSPTLASATVSVTGGFQSSQDVLAFVNDGSTMGNISASYDAGTGVLTLVSAGSSATVAQWQSALRSVTYGNSSEAPNTSLRTISFVVNDGNSSSSAATRTVSVTSVNDAPAVAVPGSIAVTEDLASALTGISFSDADAGGASVTATFSVASGTLAATSGGGVTVGGTGSALTLVGTVANINAFIAGSNLSYTPAANATADVTLTVAINDGGSSGIGGAQNTSDTLTLTINAVNDAPVVTTPVSINVTEDALTPLTGISFADVDAGGSTVTASLTVPSGTLHASSGSGVVVSGSGSGSLSLSGSIADLNAFIASNAVGFQTALNSTSNVVLSVSISDNGNTGSGGNRSDSDTITLVVTAVNDAPVNAIPAAQPVDQDATLVFSSGNGNLISISDVDAGGGTLRIMLTASNGLLTLSGTTGLSFIAGSGTGDGTMTFEGSIADINQSLNGLTFAPTPGYNGAASLQIVTSDLGLSGSGGTQTDSDTIAITVNSLAPRVTDVRATSPDGGYKVGDTITLTLSFQQVVTVDTTGGLPTLLLETGVTDRLATYVSGSGSDTLTFSYTVQAGDSSADLDYQSPAALALNGATIRNAVNDDAVLTLPAPGGASSIAGQHDLIIDGVAPEVVSVSAPADGTYVAGQHLDFTVNLSEALVVDSSGGTPRLAVALDTGGTAYANYLSGSGSSALVFRMTVTAGQLDTNGITLGSIQANGATLRDAVGNNAILALNGVDPTVGVLVDAIGPQVGSFNSAALSPGSTSSDFTLVFDEPVSGVDLSDFRLVTSGSASATLQSVTQVDARTYRINVSGISGSGTVAVELNPVASGISDAHGNLLTAPALSLALQLGQDAGDPQFRANPPPVPMPVPPPSPPAAPPAPPPSPLAPPPLFEPPTLGNGVPTLGNIFISNGAISPSFIAQVFSSDSGADGSGSGFLGFGGGDGGVFGSSSFSTPFQTPGPSDGGAGRLFGAPGRWNAEGSELRQIFGAPSLGQQLREAGEADARRVAALTDALRSMAQSAQNT